MFPTRKPFIRGVKRAIWITDNYAGECVLSQSRKAAFMHVCQPLPAKAKGTKGLQAKNERGQRHFQFSFCSLFHSSPPQNLKSLWPSICGSKFAAPLTVCGRPCLPELCRIPNWAQIASAKRLFPTGMPNCSACRIFFNCGFCDVESTDLYRVFVECKV